MIYGVNKNDEIYIYKLVFYPGMLHQSNIVMSSPFCAVSASSYAYYILIVASILGTGEQPITADFLLYYLLCQVNSCRFLQLHPTWDSIYTIILYGRIKIWSKFHVNFTCKTGCNSERSKKGLCSRPVSRSSLEMLTTKST